MRQRVAPGDSVHIPAKIPHARLIEPGKQITYSIFKVKPGNYERPMWSRLSAGNFSGAAGSGANARSGEVAAPVHFRLWHDPRFRYETLFQFKKEQLASSDMVVPCYLVAHPKGVLLWDAGVIPDTAFKADGKPVSAPLLMATTTLEKPLLPRMAALGYTPHGVTYVAFSHFHSDHVANANAFAGSTWLVHKTERDAMFAVKREEQAAYSKLKTSKTVTDLARLRL